MIILPDKNIARAKYLPPMLRCEWQAFGGDANIHFQTWLAQAYRADYSMVWQGHFEDREDADEFMAALISGVIKHDRYLRQLPVYCPDFDPDMLRDPSIQYNMVTNLGIDRRPAYGLRPAIATAFEVGLVSSSIVSAPVAVLALVLLVVTRQAVAVADSRAASIWR